jgi:hypothetical protein
MSKAPSKNTAVIQRLLEERRQYEAWIARIDAASGAAPAGVRGRVRSDYEARLNAVTEELKVHAEAARQMAAQRREFRVELQQKEKQAAERLSEAELRHAVGEYDESQWTQVHKDILSELVSVREELKSVDDDIGQLEELERLVKKPVVSPPPAAAAATSSPNLPRIGSPPRPPPKPEERKPAVADELAFLKSVTEDPKRGIGSGAPRRVSGAQFQPAEAAPIRPATAPAPAPTPSPADSNEDAEAVRTLKCKECGTMNLPTEWYCESCGAELAAL